MEKKISESKKFKQSAIIGLLASLLILIAINVISSYLYFRVDLTKDKRHTLSESTVNLLTSLDDKVYIKVYLKGENQPADYEQFAEKTREILEDFRNYTHYIHFEFIDPIKGKTKEESNLIFGEFYKKGLTPIPISEENGAGYSTHYVVPGAMIAYKNKEYPATLVVADPSNETSWLEYSMQELEYNFVDAIRKLVHPHKASVAFIEGHGELDFMSTSWMHWQLQRFYNVERVEINGRVNALREIELVDSVSQELKLGGNKYDVLIVAQPTQPFSEMDKFIIDQHVMRGGKILWLIDPTTAAIDSLQSSQEQFIYPRPLRLENLFFKYGVRMNTSVVQDLACQAIPLEVGRIGNQPQYKFMAFPYAIDIVNFSDHPIVRKMKEIKSEFASTIDLVGNSEDLRKTVLMTTSERTKIVPSPSIVTLNVARANPNVEEFAIKYMPLAVLVEGKFVSAYKGLLPVEFDTIPQLAYVDQSPVTRQIFVADGDIIRNFIDNKNQPYPAGFDRYTGKQYDNSDFILNCVNYLCADDDLLQIRAKSLKVGALDPILSKTKKTFYAIFNIVVPLLIIILIGCGLIVWRRVKYRKGLSQK
ncbi:MAG: gliding motility-associated ABC transporter substrate-binding protein GldG [Bacteroidales bacterium]|nr:gliding motility-associated ABC transporter substrate-binding protein GldG [Bacteroidales bacterium]